MSEAPGVQWRTLQPLDKLSFALLFHNLSEVLEICGSDISCRDPINGEQSWPGN